MSTLTLKKPISQLKEHNWNSFIGNIWHEIFSQYGLEKQGTLVEIAPGSVNKIGNGLSNYGFNGKLYLIEPNLKSLVSIAGQYNQSLKADIRPVPATLKQAIPTLPGKVHAIIANHPLDDMIVGKYLDEEEFDNFFDDHYDNDSADKTRQLWQRLESDEEKLQSIKQNVANEFYGLIEHTNPDLVVISQYESYFFKSNNITAPDKHAFDVLKNIKNRHNLNYQRVLGLAERYVKDPARWLILEKPKQNKKQ